MDKIEQLLQKLFEEKRIIFWYDAEQRWRETYAALTLPDVEKIELGRNLFGVKYRLLRQQPDQKFLLYHAGAEPSNEANWLLDVQLAEGVFTADQVGLWLNELGLPIEFRALGEEHAPFFESQERRGRLRELLRNDDRIDDVRLKMVAICAQREGANVAIIMRSLFDELAQEREDRRRLIERCRLADFLYRQLERLYGYQSAKKGVEDFLWTLFSSTYARGMGDEAHIRLELEATILIDGWKDSQADGEAFKQLARRAAEQLGIREKVVTRPWLDLLGVDYFEEIEQEILTQLVLGVERRTVSVERCKEVVAKRRRSVWFEKYQALYESAECASRFLGLVDSADLQMTSLADGMRSYARQWYEIDQLYRQFWHATRRSNHGDKLQKLADQVEKYYANRYLMVVNNHWQRWVDSAEKWDVSGVVSQTEFFERFVGRYLRENKKVVVIISDGLRYECGEELGRLLRQEKRISAEVTAALTMLPSYTQLGMAALLPHRKLTLQADQATLGVLIDGVSSQGVENRSKILTQAVANPPYRKCAVALQLNVLNRMNAQARRELIRDHDLVYLYQNVIDSTGDDSKSEERVFDAVQECLQELVKAVKRLTGDNVNNLLISADHGFLYQQTVLTESDFISQEPVGEQLDKSNRRFVLGRGLQADASFKHFRAEQVGLTAESGLELLIPKSIYRLRKQGAGSRYVHGGAALQEVIVPIIAVHKSRSDDIEQVEIDIISETQIITTNQLTVIFYQTQPVTEKRQGRTLQAILKTKDGKEISDRYKGMFDSQEESGRVREMKVTFLLTREADTAEGQEVTLHLEEVGETSYHKPYKTRTFQMRRAFGRDFDEW